MGQQFAQIEQAGYLGAELAEGGLDHEIIGRRHPLEEAIAFQMAGQGPFDVVVDLFPTAWPPVAQPLGDGVETDQIDPAFLEHARRLKTLKRRTEFMGGEALDARAGLQPVGDKGTGHEPIEKASDYLLVKRYGHAFSRSGPAIRPRSAR